MVSAGVARSSVPARVRKLTTSSRSSPSRRRLSCTCARSDAGELPGSQPPRSSRTTPTLVTMCTWSPYGKSASRMDDLVGDVRAVGVGRVDVVDAQLDRGPQHLDRGRAVARRPEDAGAGELHRAVAD